MFPRTAFAGSQMQLLVELRHIAPRIWRRLLVPADLPLDLLHEALQIAFGWTNSHLHGFEAGDVRFGMADVADELLVVDECGAPLGAVAHQGSTFVYQYDFGDDWLHDVTVEAIIEPPREPLLLTCLEGARACPPEDCGGVPGYENVLAALRDPKHVEHADVKRWVGRGYDPERFELEKVNKKLVALGRRFERATRRC